MSTADNAGYTYIGSGLRDSSPDPSADSVTHDTENNHPGNEWNNVLFLDAHVEGANPLRERRFRNQY